MQAFRIDARKIKDFSSFIEEVNANFISAIEGNVGWKGNLDALNDYLSWPDEKYQFIIDHSSGLKRSLSYPETAKWLLATLETCHPSNIGEFRARLEAAKKNRGETVYDRIIQIFKDNSEYVELLLK